MTQNAPTTMFLLSEYADPTGRMDAYSGIMRALDDIRDSHPDSLFWGNDYAGGGTLLVDGSFWTSQPIALDYVNAVRFQGLGQWASRLYTDEGHLFTKDIAGQGSRELAFRDLSLQVGPNAGSLFHLIDGFIIRSSWENVRMRTRSTGNPMFCVCANHQMHACKFSRVEMDRAPVSPGGAAAAVFQVNTMNHGFNDNTFDTIWAHGNNSASGPAFVLDPLASTHRYVGNSFHTICGQNNGAGLIHASYQRMLLIDAACEWDYSVDGVNATPYVSDIIRLTSVESNCVVRASGRAMSEHPMAAGMQDVTFI